MRHRSDGGRKYLLFFYHIRSSQYLPKNYYGETIIEMGDLYSDNYFQTYNYLRVYNPLKYIYFLESLFQGSKIFSDQGPNEDIYEKPSIDAKKDERIKRSDLKEFSFFGEIFSLDFDFYSWLYFIALNQNKKLKTEILNYEAFTDIEFNPEKSLNCQAYSAALYSSMVKNKILVNDKEYDIGELKNLMPSKKIKNYQQKLI